MKESTIKVGVITDQTGALSFMGIANANVANGATVFRDPSESDRMWVIFDWEKEGFQSYLSDPEVPAIIKEAGHKGKPQAAELVGQYGS